MIAKWKSQFLEAAPQIFLDKRRKENTKQEVKVDDLYKQIGKLQVEKDHAELSISRQCELLGITRSSVYYQKARSRKADLILEEKIMQVYLNIPFYGYRRIAKELVRQGHVASPKRVYRLIQRLGIKAIYPKRNLSIPNKQHKKYP
jgi:putative transposase